MIDTNVLANALIAPADLHAEALHAVGEAADLVAPDSLRAELLSVLWQWSVSRNLPASTVRAALLNAEALIRFHPIAEVAETALDLAVARRHSPYDTLFVALAMQRADRVLTYDVQLRERFPEWCVHPSVFLSS